MEEMGGEAAAGPWPWEVIAAAACEPLRNRFGVFVTPSIPDWVSRAVAEDYLALTPGEHVLAVLDGTDGWLPGGGCTLTTRRVCWAAPGVVAVEGPAAVGSPGDVSPKVRARAVSMAYEDLPESLSLPGWPSRTLDLGRGRALKVRVVARRHLKALAGVLETLRRGSRGEDITNSLIPGALKKAGRAVRPSAASTEGFLRRLGDRLSFEHAARSATPRVVVTPLVVLACVGVFAAMVVSGVSAANPSVDELYAWGGGSGAAVALNGEAWRLFTAMFLHGGLLHLVFNMWCLLRTGPLVERAYGNLGHAALYLISGVGASLASAWWHPLAVGVGASGAIFGVIGGLLAFLTVHRSTVPATELAPLRNSTLAFAAYYLLPGMFSAGIDNAAHLGGLATGFVAGLVLSRPWPVSRPNAGLGLQMAKAGGLALGLGVAAWGVTGQIRGSPALVDAQRKLIQPLEDYNALTESLRPSLVGYDEASGRLDALLNRLEQGEPPEAPAIRRDLDALVRSTEAGLKGALKAEAGDSELEAVRRSFAGSLEDRLAALRALRRFFDAPEDLALIDGPQGFKALSDQSAEKVDRFNQGLKGYRSRHQIVLEGEAAP